VTPDIILLGFEMSGMQSYEIIAKLKESEKTRDIPVIFMAQADDPFIEAEALAQGADDFMIKPFDPDHLSSCVEACLRMNKIKNHRDNACGTTFWQRIAKVLLPRTQSSLNAG
jgi:putative two-component system response regulator